MNETTAKLLEQRHCIVYIRNFVRKLMTIRDMKKTSLIFL